MLLFSIILGHSSRNTYPINSVRLVMNCAQLTIESTSTFLPNKQNNKQTCIQTKNKQTINNNNRTNKNTILIYFLWQQKRRMAAKIIRMEKNNVDFPRRLKTHFSYLLKERVSEETTLCIFPELKLAISFTGASEFETTCQQAGTYPGLRIQKVTKSTSTLPLKCLHGNTSRLGVRFSKVWKTVQACVSQKSRKLFGPVKRPVKLP